MRRFIKTGTGQAISLFTIFALVLPLLTLIAGTRTAQAQLELRDTWAVVEFADRTKSEAGLGKTAAEFVNTEFAKLNRYDMALAETVNRFVTELGYQNPVGNQNELVRLGQSLQATTIVSGEVVDTRVVDTGSGKRGEVKLRVIVRDIASGTVVNGAALKGMSAVRTGDVDNGTLINDALAQAAFQAVSSINSNTLPKATVLNTTDKNALINQGSRSGFQNGQEVIVTRGQNQVASGTIADVEPDSAFVRVGKSVRGVQPGDRVQVVFKVPELKSGWTGGDVVRDRKSGNASAIITVLLVLGLAVFLLGSGRSSNNNTITDLSASLLPPANDTRLAIQLSWRPDAFIKEPYRFQWQIWRNDVATGPIMVVDGRATSAVDDGLNTLIAPWYDMRDAIPGLCNGPSGGGAAATPATLASGVPYQYSIELIYRTSALDSPDAGGNGGGTTSGGTGTTSGGTGTTSGGTGSTSGGTGTTSGGTGSTSGGTGSTSGGTGSTSGSTGADYCYGVTPRKVMNSTITPFRQPTLTAPDDAVTLAVPTVFRFESMRRSGSTIPIEYILQFSSDPLFPSNNTLTVSRFTDTSAVGTVSTPGAVAVNQGFAGVTDIYWRVGVRNAAENTTYTYSGARKFKRPVNPPSP